MKKLLNSLGIFGSVILTVLLSVLLFLYVVILNIKMVVGKTGITNTFKRIDVVETLKNVENGTAWEDLNQLGEKLNLTEDQLTEILNSKKIKEQVGSYLGEVVSSSLNDKQANLTKEKVEEFLSIAIDEYNKVSDTKINDELKNEIITSFDEEMIDNLNEEMGSINLKEEVSKENVKYIELLDNVLFGNYTLILLAIIIFIIGLIALFRFSYYKWIPYVKVSTIISGILMIILGVILLIIPLQDMEILLPIKNIVATNIFITSGILIILSIGLSIGKKYLKKYSLSKKENNKENEEIKKEVKKEQNNKKDKKTIIIIILILIIVLIILFLILGRNRSYTITFDTNGGSEITSIEVKNNEIVKLPEPPTREGYKFVAWTNEEGKVLTSGTKVNKDLTIKAEWISNKAKTFTVKFDADGGSEIGSLLIEKGNNVLLPINPVREGYKFVGWTTGDNRIVTTDTIINKNTTLKAMWISDDIKTQTVKFDTVGGTNIDDIVIENGKVILLPENPTKEGFVFAGWVDENGNTITKETIIEKNTIIKATWKNPYTCPTDCKPTGDGSKCVKTTTKDLITYSGCPTGTETIEKFCSSHKWTVTIGFDEDQTTEIAGIICSGKPSGYCVDYNNRYTTIKESCPTGYFKYYFSESGLDAVTGCAKKYDKGGTGCPAGYTKEGNKCIKTETIKCKAN